MIVEQKPTTVIVESEKEDVRDVRIALERMAEAENDSVVMRPVAEFGIMETEQD